MSKRINASAITLLTGSLILTTALADEPKVTPPVSSGGKSVSAVIPPIESVKKLSGTPEVGAIKEIIGYGTKPKPEFKKP